MPDHIGSDADSETKDAFLAYCFDVGVLEDEDEDEDEDEVNGPPQQSDDPPKHQGAADADDPPKHQGAADADEQQERKRKLTSHIPDSPDALNNVSEEITQFPASEKRKRA